jgi:prepilin-type N-terminal cleavage/methylation domain-containing protein
MQHPNSRERGFTLVEVIISAGLLAGAAASAAYLVAKAVEDGERARLRTTGTIAAVQKMEQLRSLAWDGASDTTTDITGEVPAPGGTGLMPSPPGTLDENVPGYADYLEGDGALLPPGASASAALARRWAIRPHPLDPDVLILHVVVTRARGPASRSAAGPGPFDIELVSYRARHQP